VIMQWPDGPKWRPTSPDTARPVHIIGGLAITSWFAGGHALIAGWAPTACRSRDVVKEHSSTVGLRRQFDDRQERNSAFARNEALEITVP